MGFYYGRSDEPPPAADRPPGCFDVIVVMRAVFSVLFWPILALFLVILVLGAAFWAFTVHPALALLPLGAGALGVWLFARWEQHRLRPPDA